MLSKDLYHNKESTPTYRPGEQADKAAQRAGVGAAINLLGYGRAALDAVGDGQRCGSKRRRAKNEGDMEIGNHASREGIVGIG